MTNSTALGWTLEADERLRQMYPDTPWQAMEATLGFSRSAIKNRARRLGLRRELARRLERCINCKTPVESYPSRPRKFCSRACQAAIQRGEKSCHWKADKLQETLPCSWCGAEVLRWPSQLRRSDRRTFCSKSCAGAYRIRHSSRGVSKLEQRFCKLLREAGGEFEVQVRFKAFILDIAVPDRKLAVEVDGDYWHSLPEVIEKDARKDAALLSEGWRVMHVRERYINLSPNEAVRDVLNFLS